MGKDRMFNLILATVLIIGMALLCKWVGSDFKNALLIMMAIYIMDTNFFLRSKK